MITEIIYFGPKGTITLETSKGPIIVGEMDKGGPRVDPWLVAGADLSIDAVLENVAAAQHASQEGQLPASNE